LSDSDCAPLLPPAAAWNSLPASYTSRPVLNSFLFLLSTVIATVMYNVFHYRCPAYLRNLVTFAESDSARSRCPPAPFIHYTRSAVTQGRRLYVYKVFIEYPLNLGSDYFNAFRKSHLWRDINHAILLFFLQKLSLLGL